MNKQKLSAICGLGALTLITGFGLSARPASALPTALPLTRLAAPILDHDGTPGWGGWQDHSDQDRRQSQENPRRDRENRERDRENRRRDEENRSRDAENRRLDRQNQRRSWEQNREQYQNRHDQDRHRANNR